MKTDVKMDVKLDMELDMKISHGRAREREACARGEVDVQAGPRRLPGLRRRAGPSPVDRAATGCIVGAKPDSFATFRFAARLTDATGLRSQARDHKLDNQENKDSADIITWREFEALRNEMRREFRTQDDELKGTVEEINQKMDATNETVTAMADQMTDIQRTLQTLQLVVDNLTNQQQQQDEDPDDIPGRANRPRGWAPLGR
ncbi:hypothetical protein QYE76_037114 [Lolium multiflorum]|uniref:Uncharacterized protein n=1 Tax=Lolium multiflorum TaxID=4521 RepID=A0AAD8R356_LOLMU|nr:hypothetical protein QYE76_037114 [Lolium multiflorum]